MKKIFFGFCFSFLFLTPFSQAQKYNLRFEPIPLALGILNGALDITITDQITVGPKFSAFNWSLNDVTLKGFSIGGSGRYYFDRFYSDSWFAGAMAEYLSADAKVKDLGIEYTGSANAFAVYIGGGYHWFWKSFNQSLAGYLVQGGADVTLKDSNGNTYKDSANLESRLKIEYALGWVF